VTVARAERTSAPRRTIKVAIMDAPAPRRTAQRVPYAEASRVLLRDSILDGMREMLMVRDWSSITLTDVARAAGISRQTIYNEFGSRQGLAQAYALRLGDRLVDDIDAAINNNVGLIHEAFLEGFRAFFVASASDPLVISLLSGAAKPDLLQIITTDSGPIITRCSQRLTTTFQNSWIRATEEDSGVLARAIVRLALSYVSMPPEADHDVARDLARLMTPFAERYGVIDTP
jgi:AcrR family transcriptional regulator